MNLDIRQLVTEHSLTYEMHQGNFGIEKEGLRTEKDTDYLALTDHPHTLGSRQYHPYIQTDFSESQPEIITPALSSVEEVYHALLALHDVLNQSMAENEYIWPFSMPNRLPSANDIPIIRVENEADIKYREYLAQKYGRKLQLISGIHYNFSFGEEWFEKLFEVQAIYDSKQQLKDAIYLKLAQNFLRYEWLLLYLYGAAPYALDDFYESANGPLPIPKNYSRSIRNGEYGYHNDHQLVVRYDSIKAYIQDILAAVEAGELFEEREFYGNARLRGGRSLQALAESGIQYVEFRSFDINPYAEVGITKEQLAFIHLFFLAMVWMDKTADQKEIKLGEMMQMETAKEDPFAQSHYIEEGRQLLDLMHEVLEVLNLPDVYKNAWNAAYEVLHHPEETIAARIVSDIKKTSYQALGHSLGMKYNASATEKPYRLRGFEHFELSTQLLIFDSLQLGLELEVLDASDQFIKLNHQGHAEYVRKGNMTSKDSTISHFIMENKTVTKKVLAHAGFRVPYGKEFNGLAEAMEAYDGFKNMAVVVKPKSTNYGWGISVFKSPPTKKAYEEAVKIALDFDDSFLVEEYIPGTEYRFFVLNGETKAVLLRVPANVTGDGHSTIEELIDIKNEDPLRGINHQTPMGRLEKGKIERLMLHEQGLDFHSVPPKGKRIFLRENSNISTGGDSIDMTDQMDPSYKKVAENIAQAIDVSVTGIDLIIPDFKIKSTKEKPGYVCLEANFNPAMNMHAFVTKGKGHRLTRNILEMLFPEAMQAKYWQPYELVFGKND
ncbi:bifunctional glutamate--cysteine ligase GshA/glutathione synthetase GshB [Allofustis seminis]|uniref:bifunctional glutamate--cysteine ligase GshA/glutathione synthetase GshB n=1 Tax=Allofustis seminis TaxID=166939 RepID=UPI0003726641|nr:bifunctional glutamate--cysteine ligase GshA/glutathione synthetase GshB [Allofustis seminis]